MRRGFKLLWWCMAAAACLLLVTGCQNESDGPQQAPELAGQDLDGARQNIADHAGEVIVVNVWASWCAPCRDEMPVLAEAQETLGDDGLQILGLNTRDRPEAAEELVEETGVQFPSIVDAEGMLAVEWGVVGMPQTFVVDREGYIVDRRFGAVGKEWVDSTLMPLVHQGREP